VPAAFARTHRVAAWLCVLALLAAGCGAFGNAESSDEPGDGAGLAAGGSGSPGSLSLVPASFDLAVGDDQRLLVAVFTADHRPVAGGQISLQVSPLPSASAGAGSSTPAAEPVTATASYLPIPGNGLLGGAAGPPSGASPADDDAPPSGGVPSAGAGPTGAVETADEPSIRDGSAAPGVYQAEVDLRSSGYARIAVTVELASGETRRGRGAVRVGEEHAVPAPGEEAPETSGWTLDSDVPRSAVDSRAGPDTPVPDPELHRTTVAGALADGRPVVVLVSTPVYCTSRVCGPITEAVAALEQRYGDRIAFVHLEVWRDFDAGELNPAARRWIGGPEQAREPWTFLVGADGVITRRWSNVLDVEALVDELEEL